MKRCTVTTRRYIRRNDGAPTEPTHTLVLTSHVGHFVDIRALAPPVSSSPASSSPCSLPLPGVSRGLVEPTDARQTLDWAFAGRAWTADRPGDEGAQKCGWTHVVDSKFGEEGEVDEGIMRVRTEKGVDGKEYEWEVETGSSENTDGSVQTYEEGWLPMPTYLDSTKPYVVSDTDDTIIHFRPSTTAPPKERTCVVLSTPRFYDEAPLPAGLIIKVGDWCQGVLRTSAAPEGFFASRWMRRGGQWEMLLDTSTGTAMDAKDDATDQSESGKGGSMEAVVQWLAKNNRHMGATPPIPEWHGAKFVLKAVHDE